MVSEDLTTSRIDSDCRDWVTKGSLEGCKDERSEARLYIVSAYARMSSFLFDDSKRLSLSSKCVFNSKSSFSMVVVTTPPPGETLGSSTLWYAILRM